MKYKIYKMDFHTALHIGSSRLTEAEYHIPADTLFSALCHEALLLSGEEGIERMVELCKADKLRFTDAFPYHDNTLYIPKPLLEIQKEKEGDSSEKKSYKKLKCIPMETLGAFAKGDFRVADELAALKEIGKSEQRAMTAVFEESDAKPFSVGVFRFNENWGLYFIVGYKEDSDLEFLEALLMSLEQSGIGGKRSSGLGKFSLKYGTVPENMVKLLTTDRAGVKFILLTTSMAEEETLPEVMKSAHYTVVRRGGFVSSTTHSPTLVRKKDFFMFGSGSVFETTFKGIIKDVSAGGNHPVYRYGMPIFLEVQL